MTTRRVFATATLLPTGQVLVAGGSNFAGVGGQNSAELYNPASGTFTPTGAMTTPREFHSATLLKTGKVLIAGGGVNSAELYDPGTGTFTPTDNMTQIRAFQTATLLNDGRVLVTGGTPYPCSGCDSLQNAEYYDPTTGAWTNVGYMAAARMRHTATLLNNGQVLIAGGCAGLELPCATVTELYDPATNTFTTTGSMTAPRYGATATLLPDGRVLMAGGCDNVCDQGLGAAQSSAEMYDPASGLWTAAESMSIARAFHTATLLPNGNVLVTGGIDSSGHPLTTAEVFNPTMGAWTSAGAMSTSRILHTATLLHNGHVLIAGGCDATVVNVDCATPPGVATTLYSAELYNPTGGPVVTFAPTTATFPNQPIGTISSPLRLAVSNIGSAPLRVRGVVVVGGAAADFSQQNTCIGPAIPPQGSCILTLRFRPRGFGTRSATLLLLDNSPDTPDELPVSGYGSSSDAWMPAGTLSAPRSHHTTTFTLLPDGQVLVVGGCGCTSAELYNPNTGAWILTGAMNYGRSRQTATMLLTRQVLVAGCDSGGTAEIYRVPTLAATPASVHVGQRVVVTGSNFVTGEQVALYWDSFLSPLVTTSATGTTGLITATITVPSSTAGFHSIIAFGQTSGLSAITLLLIRNAGATIALPTAQPMTARPAMPPVLGALAVATRRPRHTSAALHPHGGNTS